MGDSGVAAILSTKPIPMWGPVLEQNRKGRYAEAEKEKDEDNLLSLVETRVVKQDRMKKAKVKSGRYSHTFGMESHDGTSFVRYDKTKQKPKTVHMNNKGVGGEAEEN